MSAVTSSNLKVDHECRGDADYLIAAGWSDSRIGAALLRLHTEWDQVEHKPLATAKTFTPTNAGNEAKAKAALAAHAHNIHETKLMLARLKTLPQVREQVGIKAIQWGIECPHDVAAAVIRWWLSQTCQQCHGTKFETIPGTGRLSARACKACAGTGLAPVPHGQAGRRLANWMDKCMQLARANIKSRLHSIAKHV